MRVLVACEYSGRVRDAFIALGHDATSCDLLPTAKPGPHYEGDVFDILEDDWDLMVAHPPCTYLCNSGVRWLYEQDGRWQEMEEGAEFFRQLLEAPIPHKAIENPIMHGYGSTIIGRKQDQIIHPWMFGHPERKSTCLWLENLPPLKATHDVKAEMEALPAAEQHRLHRLPPGPMRAQLRGTTFEGIAKAMAAQWGGEMAVKSNSRPWQTTTSAISTATARARKAHHANSRQAGALIIRA